MFPSYSRQFPAVTHPRFAQEPVNNMRVLLEQCFALCDITLDEQHMISDPVWYC